jgi:hypothetical protein
MTALSTVVRDVTVFPGHYYFLLFDRNNDGLCCNGAFRVTVNNLVIATTFPFTFALIASFDVENPPIPPVETTVDVYIEVATIGLPQEVGWELYSPDDGYLTGLDYAPALNADQIAELTEALPSGTYYVYIRATGNYSDEYKFNNVTISSGGGFNSYEFLTITVPERNCWCV